MKRYFIILTLIVLVGCDGDGTRNYNDPMHELIMGKEKASSEYISFKITGTTRCTNCDKVSAEILGVEFEAYPKNSPTDTIIMEIVNNLGTFELPSIKALKGAKIELSSNLRFKNAKYGPLSKTVEVTAPDEDNGVVSVMINFEY